MLPLNRNPRLVPRLNPQFNSRLNPRFNAAINPRVNARINPKFNSRINPRFNGRINPLIKITLNIKLSRILNPATNRTLCPHINARINPSLIPNFQMPIVFNLANEMIGFLVKFERVDGYLVYDNNLALSYYALSNSADGYNLFDMQSRWIGYWIKTDVGYNEYSLTDVWRKYVIL